MNAFRQLASPGNAHYYTKEGQPAYEVKGANGKMRNPTVRDAQDNGWLPSVTTILQVWPKPGLEIYKRQQDLMAALTLARREGEGDESFIKRVLEDSAAHGQKAADFGVAAHKAFEELLQGQQPQPSMVDDWIPILRHWRDDYVTKVHWTEQVMVNGLFGYGARADALVSTDCYNSGAVQVLLDFKTQAIKENKPLFYDTWAMQLAAMQMICPPPRPLHCLSVVMDSTNSLSSLYVKLWSAQEICQAFEDFKACFEVWKRVKKYHPI
jgi:hypothetical protein